MVFMSGKTAIDVKKKLYSMSGLSRKQLWILKILQNKLSAIRINVCDWCGDF